ncbi:MAG: ribE [Planctomycetaceae bacterium]|nr:ribE [Planctomycetaceae bacterium]
MFTGLVEGQATVRGVLPEGAAVRLVLDMPPEFVGEARLGDSIALNGCCLTVVSITRSRFDFQAGTETLSKTNLGELRPGSRVNVERAVAVGARLGGHFVQGHVDGTGQVELIEQDGEWTTMWFRVPRPLTLQMVHKGSITVDGISLTLVNVEPERFSVALIPHTLAVTTLGQKTVGGTVNIETDILGKYVQKLIGEIGR